MRKNDISEIRDMLDKMANISTTKLVEEGIDFDLANLTVSYNPNHEENVDTSEENNPSKDEEILNGIPVWSIFRRFTGARKRRFTRGCPFTMWISRSRSR